MRPFWQKQHDILADHPRSGSQPVADRGYPNTMNSMLYPPNRFAIWINSLLNQPVKLFCHTICQALGWGYYQDPYVQIGRPYSTPNYLDWHTSRRFQYPPLMLPQRSSYLPGSRPFGASLANTHGHGDHWPPPDLNYHNPHLQAPRHLASHRA